MKVPSVRIGIMHAPKVKFRLQAMTCVQSKEADCTGVQTVCVDNGRLRWNRKEYTDLTFRPLDVSGRFELEEVMIGIAFHWERTERQTFEGELHLMVVDNEVCVINVIDVERYLCSVISSEMSPTASLPLLKAHAVISRSWLLAQLQKQKMYLSESQPPAFVETSGERIKWYDREDHLYYDVCADDHCQRYQGVARLENGRAVRAVEETFGEVLMYDGTVCDARFSKCCGGSTELFENCWEPLHHPYLESVSCGKKGSPDFCDTDDPILLAQVLNGFDQETTSFYRWKVEFTQAQISALFARKSGFDVGLIDNLIPLEVGPSGRIVRLRVCGSKKSVTIGKELEIRRCFSENHLYSAAFTVEKRQADGEIGFVLHGKGWGHGVGLCQIGAAVMGEKGYDYRAILAHYYRHAQIIRLYNQENV